MILSDWITDSVSHCQSGEERSCRVWTELAQRSGGAEDVHVLIVSVISIVEVIFNNYHL